MEKKEKVYYTSQDIKERYGCGINKARSIMRAVRSFQRDVPFGMTSVPGAIGSHKILASELERWEKACGGNTHDDMQSM